MWQFIYHWIYKDIWCVTYPNWIASGVVVILIWTWGKRELLKLHNKLNRHHEELKKHISNVRKGVK
jgi:hypothetical protein